MMTAGRRQRRRRVAIGIAIFVIVMHAVAYSVVGSFAAAPLDRQMLVGITVTVLLSWLLMVSQAMESMTRAFYARADLDLILPRRSPRRKCSRCASPPWRCRWR